MVKYISIARKIHRIMVLIITVLTLIMAFTGSLLKYSFMSKIFPFIDPGMARYIHNNISPLLTLGLMIMIITGLTLYLSPFLVKLGKK